MLMPPAALEALLFAAGEPFQKKQLSKLLDISLEQLDTVIGVLGRSLKDHGLTLIVTDTDVELRTAPEASDIVKKLHEDELARDLGKGSLETLAVIAYQTGGADVECSGTSRGEIDWVRGVNSSASIRTLLLRGIIEGREDEHDKRRVRYSLTTEALAHLGITRTADLPRFDELQDSTRAIVKEKEITDAPTI
ncbi:MAG: SMC-Scp complex subunit ScpB [Candidatus Paceibacterota bacterium]